MALPYLFLIFFPGAMIWIETLYQKELTYQLSNTKPAEPRWSSRRYEPCLDTRHINGTANQKKESWDPLQHCLLETVRKVWICCEQCNFITLKTKEELC